MKRPFSKLAIAAALCGLSGSVFALGFGRLNSVAVLGQSLNLAIPVRLEPGEDLIPTCVAADVYFGDTKQLQDLVQVRIEGQPGIASERTLRVLTSARVNEPVVTIYLVAGCQSKVTRKFVAFADPPGAGEVPVALPSLEGPVGNQAEQTAERSSSRPDDSVYSGLVPAPVSTPPRAERGKRGTARTHKGEAKPESPNTDQPVAVAAMPVRAKPADPVKLAGLDTRGAKIGKQDKSGKPSKAAKPPVQPAEPAGQSRLVLDPVESDLLIAPDLRLSAELSHVDDDTGSGGQAVRERREAAAALWRALNATPEQLAHDRQRLQELEARLTKLQSDNHAAQDQIKSLEAEVKQAKEQRATGPMVFGLAGLSVALTMALGWLLLRQRRAARNDWWTPPADEPEQAPATEPSRHMLTPSGTGLTTPAVPTAPMLRTAANVITPQALEPAEPAQPVAPASAAPVSTVPQPVSRAVLREVSVEELIDLEQQAEFFMVLGQDDAAIDLLQGHIESTEGTSPLPYLKLLEVYQRVGNREAYEGIRERFNAQFNAYAPEWESDLQQGHVLADYVGVIERLQALWDVPERAMEVLQASLLRRNPDADTFDLPAYRELLFLYSVARDLAERDGRQPGMSTAAAPVDLLLPFGEEPASDNVEPLLATRPVKTPVTSRPAPLLVDVTLDDLDDQSSDAPVVGAVSRPGPIDFEPVDLPHKS